MSRPAAQSQAAPGNIDELNKIVIDYLNKKGYTRTEAVLRLEANRTTGAWLDGTPQAYDHAYKMLASWTEASLDIYKPELRKLLFPIFVHSFLDLVQKGHAQAARQYFEEAKGDHLANHGYDVRQMQAVVLPTHVEENELAKLYRNHKYRVSLSKTSFDLMLNFMFENEAEGGAIIMRLVNQYIEVQAMSGRPGQVPQQAEGIKGHNSQQIDDFNQQALKLGAMPMDKDMAMDVELELADEDAQLAASAQQSHIAPSEPTTLQQDFQKMLKDEAEGEQPAADAIPFPPYKAIDIATEVENIKDARKRIALGSAPASLPSVCMYTFHNTHDNLHCAEISPDSSMIGCGFGESYVKVWAIKEKSRGVEVPRTTKRMIGHSGPVYGVAFSPDNRFLLSCSEDKSARLWSLDTQTSLVAYKGHNQPVWDVAFSPFGHYFATASHDMTARLWSCDHIYPLRIFAGHLSDVDCVSFHPNSTYVLTGSSDKTCRLWDIARGHSVRVFAGHTAPITACTISPNGRMIASGGEDGVIELWDIASGRRMKTMKGHGKSPIYSLSFSQENSVLVSGGADATVRCWDVKKPNNDSSETGTPLSQLQDGAGTLNTSAAPAAATKERKELLQTSDHMLSLGTKQTPVYKVHFTKRNLCLAVSASGTI
ncbi:transcription factor TFIID complex subunit Taf5 [Protomyces lactucae-debilis]|uniref:Transcription factor TFIID complex subunit Taf5 n=1 Tax=Protomyces lactucae-debilis TaxID=2754530 RepID=A0A1Y2FES3_PROLT|nr:transcription factor TFIID complex subunit Taf5 [Protomyces lactucae-debilis]ORY82423.1 transcription factor TFIID complex subunit Taf5 [Protomyces lactucae-debilis]